MTSQGGYTCGLKLVNEDDTGHLAKANHALAGYLVIMSIQAACLFSEVVDLFDNASLPFRGNYFWHNILDIRFAPTHMDTEYGFSLSYRPVRQPGKLNQLVSAWSEDN